MSPLILLLAALVFPQSIAANLKGDDHPDGGKAKRPSVVAVRQREAVHLDGRLDEPVWQEAPAVDQFTQRDPSEGAAPTERTVVRVVYDDDALYIGAKMYDDTPDSIVARLGRRDAQLESDNFTLYIDPYLDRRSGFYFSITAAGTLSDGVLLNDDWNDNTWDGVWQGRAQIDPDGWTAELRIPYSQLRFYRKDRYVWGVNFQRFIARNNEHDYLVYTPRNGSGFVSRFADLLGIERIKPARQVEVVPYLTTRAAFTHPDAGNPFSDGSSYLPGGGLDFKVGLSSNLTLDGTINPDFGQVEVDPAVVNLSAFENYFQEKRPFFIEGASIFNFGQGGSRSNWGFNWGNPEFFYSRRVGRPPQGSLPDADFTDVPDVTRILGAAKVTGKLAGSWNVGMVHAVTGRETARYADTDGMHRAVVEPPSYYGVFRGQKEFAEGRQAIGFMSTITARDLGSGAIRNDLSRRAYVFGLDGWTFLDKSKTWVVTGWGGLSKVEGTPERMIAVQESPLRYFQRPDARSFHVDSTATSLSGFAGRVLLNKQKGNVLLNSALGVISPGFEANDAGFQWRADVINAHFGGGYQWTDPGRFTRNLTLIGAAFRSMDFDGNTIWTGLWGLAEMQFLNYYRLSVNLAYNPPTVNNRLTRGGPLALNLRGYEVDWSGETDDRKAWIFGVQGGLYRTAASSSLYAGSSVRWKPASNIDVTVGPNLQLVREGAQWVGAYDDPYATSTFGKRYVFAHLDQMTLSSDVRLNWTFTPQLSFQLFAQPLVSSGNYTRYKELARARSYAFNLYGEGESTMNMEALQVDPDGNGPAAPFQIDNPNFNFRSLRGNAVLRWEYRPGSVLYLVWTQLRSQSEEDGTFHLSRSLDRLWNARPDNIFMVKLTYWIG